jgi:hypothetical protein
MFVNLMASQNMSVKSSIWVKVMSFIAFILEGSLILLAKLFFVFQHDGFSAENAPWIVDRALRPTKGAAINGVPFAGEYLLRDLGELR